MPAGHDQHRQYHPDERKSQRNRRPLAFSLRPRRIVQKDLDIAEYTDPINNPMIPHVIVLEPGLVIHKIYNGYWFFGRPTMEDLRQDLRAVSKKCRPDWDITTPELKAAWQQGRKELFYPYGKTYVQTLGEQD